MKMSVTQGLAELKLLDKRINKAINSSVYCIYSVGDAKTINNMPRTDFEESVKSAWDSVNKLMKRRSDIKSLIINSNAITNVKIGDVTMTRAEAIERKSSICYQKELLTRLKSMYNEVNTTVERGNIQARQKAQDSIERFLGKDGKTTIENSDVDNIFDSIFSKYKYTMIDPIDVRTKIENLEKEIEDFESNVDFVLSTSNATTEIEIPD